MGDPCWNSTQWCSNTGHPWRKASEAFHNRGFSNHYTGRSWLRAWRRMVVGTRDYIYVITNGIDGGILDMGLEILYPQPQQGKNKNVVYEEFSKIWVSTGHMTLWTSCLNTNQIHKHLIHACPKIILFMSIIVIWETISSWFFICWIKFHFKVIRKKLKVELGPEMYDVSIHLYVCRNYDMLCKFK